jgi:SAM-dependent methyltransferase
VFFGERIRGVRPGDRVLEIGPGSTPHPRANEFLEYRFQSDAEAVRQRGEVPSHPEFGGRKLHHYDGGEFPFADGAFDYVIASHVIEHVRQPQQFMAEVFRVGKGRGYIEFPLPPYEYLFDFDVHLHYVWWDVASSGVRFVPKEALGVERFSNVTAPFRRSLELGWDDVIAQNPNHFFFGIEFEQHFSVRQMDDLSNFRQPFEQDGRRWPRRVLRRLMRAFA